MNDISSHELYALLVPLTEERLIVPRACVAEVVTWQQPDKMEGAPAWYLGAISWNGRAVPVISFEGTCGQTLPTPGHAHAYRHFRRTWKPGGLRLFRRDHPRLPAARARESRCREVGSEPIVS